MSTGLRRCGERDRQCHGGRMMGGRRVSGRTASMSPANCTAGRRSRTPSTDVERELIAAAETVLMRAGPGGVTVRAVAAEAGIAPMGVYNRLGGKDGLVDALLIRGFDRLRAAIASSDEPDLLDRFRGCGRRYREFAMANRHFYAIMFEGAIPQESIYDAAAGRIVAPDPREAAQQVWSTVHGAVALELNGLVLTPDPAGTYRATLEMLVRGLAA